MSGDLLRVAVADVVTLAGRADAVGDDVQTGISALNAAPPSDGLGLLVGMIVAPVLGVFTTSAHNLLSEAAVHARGTASALRDVAASFEEMESDSAGAIRMVAP